MFHASVTLYSIGVIVSIYYIIRMTYQSYKDMCKTLDWLEEEMKK